jgi:hypothetical protein
VGKKAAKSDGNDGPLVTGKVIIAAGIPPFNGATIHVYLEDVTYADAESLPVAETVINNVNHGPSASSRGDKSRKSESKKGDTVVPFELYASPDAAPIDRRHDYSVRVWVDRDGDGRRGPGDLYSDESYPVLTRGFANTTTITLAPTRRK